MTFTDLHSCKHLRGQYVTTLCSGLDMWVGCIESSVLASAGSCDAVSRWKQKVKLIKRRQ